MLKQPQAPVKVLFYEPYPMGLGGNYLTQRMILERLDRNRFIPMVASPIEGVAFERFRQLGVECVTLSPPGQLNQYGGKILKSGILGKLRAAFDLLKYNFELARFLRENRIDVVYANCVRAEMSVGLAARLAGVPSLLYIKGELANPIVDRLCFILASKILFFCHENRDDKYPGFVGFFKKKIDILRIGLDLKVVDEILNRDQGALCQELGIDPGYVNVAVVGQLYRPKGQHLALEALSHIVADFPKVRLYIIGDHVIEEYRGYKRELDALIERYHLQDNVRFTGWRKDALDIVSTMDMVVHPSLAEGFGRAVLEAMALGKPVIASKVGGLREIIKDGENGFLISPGDITTLAARWREVLLNPELRERLGREAKRAVYESYHIDDKVERLSNIWAEMSPGHH